jgi:TatA/E family protein of Tat protein translocase
MHTFLFVFEFLGTTELLVVAVVALILFGPRKLPEIGRTVGKALSEFKRASDDFKRTWEYEVELEHRKPALETAAVAPPLPEPTVDDGGLTTSDDVSAEEFVGHAAQPDAPQTVARGYADETDEDFAEGGAATPAERAGDEINAS